MIKKLFIPDILNAEFLPPLSPEAEKDLFQQLEENSDGDSAREILILSNLRLIRFMIHIVRRSSPKCDLTSQDLFQEGYFGLIRAIEYFDWRLGNKLSTYAFWWIKQAMSRAIEKQSDVIRLPTHIHDRLTNYFKIRNRLIQELKREPSSVEIAKKMNTSISMVEELRKIAISSSEISSLDISGDYGDDRILSEVLPVKEENDDEEEHPGYSDLRREDVLNAINNCPDLTSRERQIILLHFGLNDEKKSYTLAEIGKEFSRTRERIRQIKNKALKKLRKDPRIKSLRTFIN